MEDKYLLTVKDLKMYFNVNSGLFSSKQLKAVDGVTFSIKKGETLGLVGESGCGKTTVGRSIMHLYKPTGGEIIFNDRLIKSNADIKYLRSKMQMVFQDPYSSLDPRMTVGDIIGEPLDVHHKGLSKSEKSDRIKELMDSVGLSSEHATRYVHEFSGGQRQRIGIARALAMDPDMIICNEAGVDDYILTDDKWQGLRCVREGEVYQIPVGVSRMGHPTSSETPLALMWLMNLLHPDLYPIDFTEELISYYDTFYDYPISEELAEAMMEGDEMRAAKVSVSAE